MDESSCEPENSEQLQRVEASSKDKKRKRTAFFIVAAIASFIAAWICLTLSLLCFRLIGWGWDDLGSLLMIVSALLFVACPIFGIMACVVPFSNKQLIQRERFTKASRISFLIGIMFCMSGFLCGPIYFLSFLFFLVSFVLSMVSHIIFFRDRKAGRFCAVVAIIFLLFGLGFFFAAFSFRRGSLAVAALPFLTTALVLSIIVHIISFHSKQLRDKVWSIAAIFLLSILLLILIPIGLHLILPLIYTPPALTPENMVVYTKCIKFAKDHDKDKTLMLNRGARVVIGGKFYMLSKGNTFERNRARAVFSEEEIIEMETLCHQLYKVRCVQFLRHNDMLLFGKMASSILPLDPGFLYAFDPVSPGVLYSLNGKNPNEIDSEILNDCKPFIKIHGDWYMSRRLIWAGPRSEHHVSIPKSLIDHSLRTEGLDIDSETSLEKVFQPTSKP